MKIIFCFGVFSLVFVKKKRLGIIGFRVCGHEVVMYLKDSLWMGERDT